VKLWTKSKTPGPLRRKWDRRGRRGGGGYTFNLGHRLRRGERRRRRRKNPPKSR